MIAKLLSFTKLNVHYGISLGILLFVVNKLEFSFLVFSHNESIYFGASALLFTVLGIWLAGKLSTPRVEKVS